MSPPFDKLMVSEKCSLMRVNRLTVIEKGPERFSGPFSIGSRFRGYLATMS